MEHLVALTIIGGFILTIATVLLSVGGLRQQLRYVISTLGDSDSGLVKKVDLQGHRITKLEEWKRWNQQSS